jgi:competence ComEA-like helix-hairpin-helix protein
MPFVQIKQADRPPSYKPEGNNQSFSVEGEKQYNKSVKGEKPYPNSNEELKNYYKSNKVIEINAAGIEDFESLSGIGLKLAERIIKYRDKLGGFYDVNQVAETFGIQDSVFQKFKGQLKCDRNVKKIPINHMTSKELSEHPYFRGKLSTLLVNYRQEHGPFTTMEDLVKIPMINDQVLGRIRPYISLEEKK